MGIRLDELRATVPPAVWRQIEATVRNQQSVGLASEAAFLGLRTGPAMRLKRRGKYNAERTQVDGVWFDSKREAGRYRTLKLLQLAGTVLWFCLQPRFVLPAGVEYRADFIVAWADRRISVEDVKSAGTRTKVYRLKKRQVEALYRVKIEEV